MRWKTTRTGVIIQRTFLDCSTIIRTSGFMEIVAYKTEDVFIFFIFLLSLNGALLCTCYLPARTELATSDLC